MKYKSALLLLAAALPAAADVVINEVRIDNPSSDLEFVELYNNGIASVDLGADSYTYLVIGDGTGGSGVIESVTPLTGTIAPGGHFVITKTATSALLGIDIEGDTVVDISVTADLATSTLNFENSDNVTHLLVQGFSGANGDDLDTNDDGTLDTTPWTTVVDAVGLIEEVNPPSGTEYSYGASLGFVDVGPDGGLVPGMIFRIADGPTWAIGAFGASVASGVIAGAPGAELSDTPGLVNPTPPTGALGLSLSTDPISESAGFSATTLTVSRTGSTTGDLTVDLSLDDATEAQLQGTQVIIFDGFASADIDIDAVDDLWVDGDQTVTISATAVNYTSADTTLTVQDDADTTTLVINEAYNVISGTSSDVNGDGIADFGDEFVEIVNVSGSTVDLSFYALRENGFGIRGDVHVFPEGTLLAPGAAIVVFSGGTITPGTTAAFGNAEIQLATLGGLFLTDNGDTVQLVNDSGEEVASIVLPDQTSPVTDSSLTLATDGVYSSGYILHTASAGGGTASPGTQNGGTPFVVVSQSLTLTVNTSTVVENDPTASNAITVSLPATSLDPTIVRLFSSDTGELLVPDSVTIPPSTLSIDVDVIPVDDTQVDGSQLVTIQAISSGYLNGSGLITVDDDGNDVAAFTDLVINEIDPDQAGTDTAEFIELYNNTAQTQSLDGLIVLLYNGGNDTLYGIYDLTGYSIEPNGFFVLGNSGVPGAQITLSPNAIQNGQDAIALVAGSVADFTSGDPVSDLALTGATIVDALVYSGADTGLQDALDPTGSSVSDSTTESISRNPDGGAGLSSGSFVLQTPTPNATNVLPASNYGTWETDNLVTEGPDGDDDDDGIKNIIEYALGLDPHAFESLASAFDGSALTFTAGAEAVTNGDLIYSIETSPDLMDPWTPVVIGLDGSNMISYTLPSGETKIFARLRVEQAP